ncbi:MAG: protein kinase [Planctomycetota bacterium]|nr:protein kinase [Planctomycetota bacterium]
MTSHPKSEPNGPAREGNNASAESPAAQSSPAAKLDTEATMAVPGADQAAPLDSATAADPELTLEQDLEAILGEFAQTLTPEQQDLNQELPQTSLKSVLDTARQLQTCSQASSVRPRSIQPTDTTNGNPAIAPAGDVEFSDSSLDYVTLDKLGEGGMGTVHLARQVALGREVALKRIHHPSSRKQSTRDEFLTEAVLTGNLEHPNIVPIYEVGESPDGDLFYTMKNVKGRTWNDTIDDLSLNENLEILIDVCDAMAFAHAEGVIHRDLKPQNIMTGGFGEVLVLDWGMAILVVPGEDVTASPGGTPNYMAPEMINPPYRVSACSDVYLLGAILFRLLTGAPPHYGETALICLASAAKNEIAEPDEGRIQSQDPTGELLGVALKAMATEPRNRYQTVRKFQQAVRDFVAHQESLTLTTHANEALQAADQHDDYAQYSAAVFGFSQAVTLWEGNQTAAQGVQRARQAYALCAERKEDFELGLSLLSESIPNQQAIIQRLTAARDDRHAHLARMRRLKQGLVFAATLIFAIVFGAAFWINQERIEADKQRHIAVIERDKAAFAEADAKREADNARRNAYTSDMLLATLDWEDASIGRLRSLLERHRGSDHSGFEWHYWDRLLNSDLRTLNGHTRDIRGVAYNPQGTQIASASFDNTVKVWDTVTGQVTRTLPGHTGPVWSVCFSPDGKRLASASFDNTAKVWDAISGQLTHTLKGHTDNVFAVCFSPDGQWLASASSDQTVKMWDMATGQEVRTLNGHTQQVVSVSFSPAGQWVASASKDNTVKVWDAVTGQEKYTLNEHSGPVWSVCFSPNGQRLASASGDKTVKIWDAVTGQLRRTLAGHTGPVWSVCFTPDGQRVASASDDTTIKVWDAETGRETSTLKGHIDDVYSVHFSPDGTRLASGSHDTTIKIWETTAGQDPLAFKGHTEQVLDVCFSPDGSRLASASDDKTVRLWDTTTGQETLTLRGHTQQVRGVTYSPEGTRIASASFDNTVKLWDAVTGQEIRTLNGHSGPVLSVSFSPDGQRLASASSDKTVKIWNVSTGQETLTLKGHADRVVSVSFSPNGEQLASASADQTVIIWQAATGQHSLTLYGHNYLLSRVCFSPDGQWLASASGDETVKVWNAATGEERLTLNGHTNYVHSVCFNPDGTRIASASRDGSVKVWDATTGQETLSLKVKADDIWSVCFSPDGTRLASASTDNTVQVRDARPPTPELRAQSQARGLLMSKRDRVHSLEDLQTEIRGDKTINDQVRQQALDWSPNFWSAPQ